VLVFGEAHLRQIQDWTTITSGYDFRKAQGRSLRECYGSPRGRWRRAILSLEFHRQDSMLSAMRS
jgi:hypothetical protein